MMKRRSFLGAIVAAFGFAFVPCLEPKVEVRRGVMVSYARRGLVGYPGKAFLGTGYVYAPYRPLYITQTYIH